MAVAGCINAYDCAGCYLTTLQQLQSDNIGVAINYTAPGEYGRRQLDYIKYTDKCGCTCCLTGENELRIVATQGVIKNFTLTNDDTNEVVNVKWNDLFGSNRAYTMVRYKTGSYPTSITDGTLAVKETTKNQYSSSGYNVSGLTDGTTYYFTAFAVSQDGTIIVVQNSSITPDYGRKPGINTIAYRPLNSDYQFTDQSGNGRNLTNVGIVIGNYQGVSCAYNSNNKNYYAWYNAPLTTSNNIFTCSLWFYSLGVSSGWQSLIQWGYGQTTQAFNMALNNNVMSVGGWSNDTSLSITKINQRVNYVITYDGTTIKAYVNKELVLTVNLNYTIPTSAKTSVLGNFVRTDGASFDPLYGYLSRVIVENKIWNLSDITKDFDKTKSTYGIS